MIFNRNSGYLCVIALLIVCCECHREGVKGGSKSFGGQREGSRHHESDESDEHHEHEQSHGNHDSSNYKHSHNYHNQRNQQNQQNELNRQPSYGWGSWDGHPSRTYGKSFKYYSQLFNVLLKKRITINE